MLMHSFGFRPVKLVVAAVAAVCLVSPSAVATASAGTSVAGSSGADVFRFTFNGHQSLKSKSHVRDATGHGHYGVIRTSGAGHLTVLRNGVKGTRAAGFPRVCIGCNRAIITVANKSTLDPGRRAFTFGAAIRATAKQAPPGRDPNILAKGANGHHKYKLHLIGAKPRCVFAGTSAEVTLTSTSPIDDGKWHRVVCSHQGKVDQLFVDGVLKASSTTTYTGPITSTSSLKIGGRAAGHSGSNDQFHGDLDNVFLHIGR
jgi:hypothetical protein